MPIISTYTSIDAMRDGVLVPIDGGPCNGKPVNFITRNLLERLFAPVAEAYADNANGDKIDKAEVVGFLVKMVAPQAQLTPDNPDGYMLTFKGTKITVWFVENELDGYTAMLPEDY